MPTPMRSGGGHEHAGVMDFAPESPLSSRGYILALVHEKRQMKHVEESLNCTFIERDQEVEEEDCKSTTYLIW